MRPTSHPQLLSEPRLWSASAVPRLALYLAAWTAIAVISASQTILTYRAIGGQVHAGTVLMLSFASWYVWAALAPLVILAARRFPLEGGTWLRRLPIHLLCNAALAVVAVEAFLLVRQFLGLPSRQPFLAALAGNLNVQLVTYWALVGLVHGADYYRRARERELRAAELSAQLAAARLEALRMQLHPHFLFNTMHAVASLVREAPAAAEDMLAELAELLRTILERSPANERSLREELTFIDRYIGIQQVRFGDRLAVRRTIDPGVLDAYIPSLVLQPLIENAIEHGIARRRSGGALELSAERRGEALVLRVTNNGPALDVENPVRGLGLENTRSRLVQLYGQDARLALRRGTRGGAEVTITLPYRLTPVETGSLDRGDGPLGTPSDASAETSP